MFSVQSMSVGALAPRESAVDFSGRSWLGSYTRVAQDLFVREGWATRTLICSSDGPRAFLTLGIDPQIVADIAGIWNYLEARREVPGSDRLLEKGALANKVLEALIFSRIQNTNFNLFVPWGPRYNNLSPEVTTDSPEDRTLGQMAEVLRALRLYGVNSRLLFMPADTYGVEVNGRSKEKVEAYFASLRAVAELHLASLCELDWRPWSAIRAENRSRYEELRNDTALNFENLISPREYEEAIRTSTAFSKGADEATIEDRARRYCIERWVEARIIEELCSPTKLSLVREGKNKLDRSGPLKALYVIREEFRAPWIK